MDRTVNTDAHKFFTRQLTSWHHTSNDRDLPWKGEKDPYRIWLSEVILQQTRALQGLPYYLSFTGTYPTVKDLATANDDDVFRIWQGLGYYNRCKNMLATARYVATELRGIFPDDYDGLLALKGIGPYTAAAIASFAYNSPHAVVDGNVYRVLSRYFGIDTPYDTTEGKKIFAALAQQLLDKKNSAAYNQAIMDLGATVCTPASPLCHECPLSARCIATQHGLTGALPVRSKKIQVKERYFNYIFFTCGDETWVQKRGDGDIWQNLWEPHLITTDIEVGPEELQAQIPTGIQANDKEMTYAGSSKQRLTHQVIHANFYIIKLNNKSLIDPERGMWLSISELKKLAFPKTLVSFFRKNLYF